MRRRLTSATATLGVLLYLSGAAYAQLKDNFELNVFGGGSWYSTKDYEVTFPQSVTPITGKFRFDHALRGGVRVGVYTRGHWSEEFFYSYEPNKAHLIRLTAPATSVNLSTQVHNYGVSALYYLDENETHSVRPFLSIGVGGTVYRLSRQARSFASDPLRGNLRDINNSHELALNYGLGIKTRASGWLGLRVDARGFVGRAPSFGLARDSNDPNATVFPVSGALHNGEASAGLVFYFFGKR
ncbi:MAG: hypothetical protein DMG14_01160 [Acidobacteria bacterium]|nr:MAG: hypothetical protein DMG14_01160 [Acidobacteriota bacterium]